MTAKKVNPTPADDKKNTGDKAKPQGFKKKQDEIKITTPPHLAPQSKQFALKPVELQMLGIINEQHNMMLSNFLSFIAMERLAYTVTELTQFSVDPNGNLHIIELPEKIID